MSTTTTSAVDLSFVTDTEAFEKLVRRLDVDRNLGAGGLWGASQPLVLAALYERVQGPWLVVVSSDAEAELALDDLATFGVEATVLPARVAKGRGNVDLDSVRDTVELAFAMTVHKAQGSEYDDVALLLPEAPMALLSRELLYTALSRSRRAVVMCGSPTVLAAGVARPLTRSSGVGEKLARLSRAT